MNYNEEEDASNEIKELTEFEPDQLQFLGVSEYTRFFLSEQHWELTFLFLCAFLFSAWFGMTAECFEDVMGYCSLAIIISFLMYGLGSFSREEIFKTNTRNVFSLSVFFNISVCTFHFLRLKADPRSIA